MTRLPPGWTAAALDELVELNPKHDSALDRDLTVSFVPMPAVDADRGEITGASDRLLDEVWKGFTHFADDDVIFAKITPCMENGKIAVAANLTNGLSCGSTEFHVLRTRGGVLPRYLWRFLRQQAFRENAERSMTGAVGQRRVPTNYLREQVLPVPPIAEQRRIVAKLNVLIARTASARAELDPVPRLADRYKLSLLRAAMSGTLTEAWRISNPHIEDAEQLVARTPQPSQGRGGRNATTSVRDGRAALSVNRPERPLPARWCWTPLLRLARQETGHTPSRSVASYWNGGVPWIGIRDAGAHHGRIITETLQTISDEGLANSSARLLPAGTVCLSRTASVGYVTIMGHQMATSQDFATWTCTPALQPKYLMYALMAEGDDIRDFGEGSTHTTIYFPAIRALNIALPPLAEQMEIIRIIEAGLAETDRLVAEATAARRLLDNLDHAILAKAFRGELVPQDPADEPASVLLDRIRAERAAAPVKSRRGRRSAAA